MLTCPACGSSVDPLRAGHVAFLDGRFVYFSSSSQDISGMNDIFRVSVEGGTPMPVSADRYVNEFFAAPSPDGAVRGAGSARQRPQAVIQC